MDPSATAHAAPQLQHRVEAKPGDPCVMIIFGVSGDLTARKLVPALYNLLEHKLLSKDFAIIGIARDPRLHEDFRQLMREKLEKFATAQLSPAQRDWLISRIFYVPGQIGDQGLFQRLRETLTDIDKQFNTRGNYFFYLATSPLFFVEATERLAHEGLLKENGYWRRVVYEKPFGTDLASARSLNTAIKKVLTERQIYRIDHYLGKETVQNMMVFRFGNGIFEPIWNRQFIDHVQITVAETVGVERRGGYFESAGTLRDMVPNHIMQLISLTAMEPPISFHADAVRDEQAKAINAIVPILSEDVLRRTVRAQYGEGEIDGQAVQGYREEPGIDPESKTETFVAMKLNLDNWRWADVPFYIRTGKRMAMRHTEVVIRFKRPPFVLFRDTPVERLKSNILVIHIAPDEGISLHFSAKIPGPQMRLGGVDMKFAYSDYFGTSPNTGYEILLYDCMIGDQTLFQRADMVEAGWTVVDPVLDVWKALPARNFPNYASGSWGPKESEDLLANDGGRYWRNEHPITL
jgi:glucose-6-phosphate 1-dehydrogenase